MTPRETLIHMLKSLLKEVEIVTSQGAGYYTCVPFAQRYNKLLGASKGLFPAETVDLVDTFAPLAEVDPKDPADKSKVMVGVRVETTQLIALLEAMAEKRDEAAVS